MKADNTLDRDSAKRWEFVVFGRYTHGPKKGSVNRKSQVKVQVLAHNQADAVTRLIEMTSDLDDKGRVIPGTSAAFQLSRRILMQAEVLDQKERAAELYETSEELAA